MYSIYTAQSRTFGLSDGFKLVKMWHYIIKDLENVWHAFGQTANVLDYKKELLEV